jgi:hypothetical protein
MSDSRVVPVIITQHRGDSDIVSAFEFAERAEKSKIAGWAQSFNFELTDPIIVDVGPDHAADKALTDIIGTIERLNGVGMVAASTEYLRHAGLYSVLPEALKKLGKRIWIADLGSLPLEDRISA